jgi:hypothetical protein
MRFAARSSRTHWTAAAVLALTLIAGSGLAPAPASAGPLGWQAIGGWYTDNSDFFVGAGARFAVGPVTAIPNAEYVFVDGGKLFTLNADGTLNVLPLAVATGYVGGGVAFVISDPDGGSSNTDTGVNLIAGMGFNAIKLHPFAQIKWIVKDGDDPFVFGIGVHF